MTQTPCFKPLPPLTLFEKQYGPARFALAPMSGITDTVFRLLMRELGAEIVISDLISAEGMVRGNQRTLEMIEFEEKERPLGIQLFGSDEDSLVEACKIVEQGGADFVDLNLGCPVKKVVSKGGGSAWLKDTALLGKLLMRMKKATSLPLTIKIRTGWDSSSINAHEVVHVAYESGVSWVAIHGRTRAQQYTGRADWELIREVAESSPLPILGNGDIIDARVARERLQQGYCHGIMIGRGALKNPWIFKQCLEDHLPSQQMLPLIERHFDLALGKKDPRRALASLKKFLGWYAAGFPQSSTFRRSLFEVKGVDELQKLAFGYFHQMRGENWTYDSSPFLMGGHG